MSATDSFFRYSRYALAAAVLIATSSVSYRIVSDRAAAAAKAAAAAAAAQSAPAMDEAQQRQMAEGMVAQLEERMKAQPDRVEGWILLMRSRMALGQPDKARTALGDALKANPGAAAEIRAQAEALGVK